MSACEHLHRHVRALPRYRAGFNPTALPANGLYFLFETGETAHGGERLVRVGTHTGDGNLAKRLAEHLFKKNKDRSIFRKHVGRCLLNRDADSFANCWEMDLTKKTDRQKYEPQVDKKRLAVVEDMVSDYMNANFSFGVMPIPTREARKKVEASLLATLAQCPHCQASQTWLGRHHPEAGFSAGTLWNVQGLTGAGLQPDEIDALFGK